MLVPIYTLGWREALWKQTALPNDKYHNFVSFDSVLLVDNKLFHGFANVRFITRVWLRLELYCVVWPSRVGQISETTESNVAKNCSLYPQEWSTSSNIVWYILLNIYVLSFHQGSPWSNAISLAILNFHESGVMEELETTWIDTKKCDEQSNSPATLGLNHMLGVYATFWRPSYSSSSIKWNRLLSLTNAKTK